MDYWRAGVGVGGRVRPLNVPLGAWYKGDNCTPCLADTQNWNSSCKLFSMGDYTFQEWRLMDSFFPQRQETASPSAGSFKRFGRPYCHYAV